MTHLKNLLFRIIIVFFVSLLLFTGCKGSDTRDAVDDTVEEFAGKKKVDQMRKMENDVEKLQDQQTDRFKDLDDMENN